MFQRTKCPSSSPKLAPNLHFDYLLPHLCVGLCFNCLQGTPVFPVTHVVHSSHLKQNHKYSFISILLSPPVIYMPPSHPIHRDSAPNFIFHISWKKVHPLGRVYRPNLPNHYFILSPGLLCNITILKKKVVKGSAYPRSHH